MSKKTGSLKYQIARELGSQFDKGQGTSKHADKQIRDKDARRETMREKIYSEQTLKSYMKQANYVLSAVKSEHPEVRTLADARPYMHEYFERMAERVETGERSAWTAKLQRSAIAKVYHEDCRDIYPVLPERKRDEIVRSRETADRDAHFSESANRDLVDFLKGTGLRRIEAEKLVGTQVHLNPDGSAHIETCGKGGKWRDIPVLPEYRDTVVRMAENAGAGRVFPDGIHSACDVHGYRGDYATKLYQEHARPVTELKKDEMYRCRGDKKGIIYDRDAMKVVSEALGHSRLSVVASNYLR